jgi:TonB family protein
VHPQRSTSPPLLKFYVFSASALAHLLLLPAWAFWLGNVRPEERASIEPDCSEQQGAPFEARTCPSSDCPSPDATKPLSVALLEQEQPKPPPEELPEQFVLTPPDEAASELPPVDAQYAGRVDTRTEKESVKRGRTPVVPRPAPPPEKLGEEAKSAIDKKSNDAPATPSSPANRSARVSVPELQPEAAEPRPEQAEVEALEQESQLVLPNFDAELLAALSRDAGTVDYLKDVDDGERTLLNRKRVAYSDFFERVMLAISAEWDPGAIYRRRDPTGQIYGVQDRVTVLTVTLEGDGKLHEVYVDSPSGLDFLDDEALRALRQAAPFPNPPEGIKGLDGRLQFRCAFHFEISTRKTRVFRYR